MDFCDICNNRLDRNGRCFTCETNEIRKSFPTKKPSFQKKAEGKTCNKCGQTGLKWNKNYHKTTGKWFLQDHKNAEGVWCIKNEGGKESSDNREPITTQLEESEPISISNNILFDVKKIPKGDRIIEKIVDGHENEDLGIIHYEHLAEPTPPKIPVEKLTDVLDESIISGLKKYGFSGVLEFQDESIRTILSGKNTIISAQTGSGKTEAFTIPIIQKILKKPSTGVIALFVYPLNALVDDQISKIKKLIEDCGLKNEIDAYSIHGKQSKGHYERIFSESEKKSLILATNFDFINYHLILQDRKWKLLKKAKILVLDEAHSYNSFHGSSVYQVVRRMKRYMSSLQYVGSSATLDNSKEFFANMFDLQENDVAYIKSKHGRKRDMHRFFIMPRRWGQRITIQKITSVCFKERKTQLVFGNTHKDAEYLGKNMRDSEKNIRIQVHRGGINPTEKKTIEGMMKNGELDVISCTPTLELGIDIGHVDVATSAFKNELDSFVQRTGRAGRQGQKSYAFCVFDPEDASCHYYSRNIGEYINQKHEVYINKNNPIILEKHQNAISVEEKTSRSFDKKQFWAFAGSISLRGTGGIVEIFLNQNKLGERNLPSGYYELHRGALYYYNMKVYEVTSLTKTSTGGIVNVIESNEQNKRTIPIVDTTLEKIGETKKKVVDFGIEESGIIYGIIEITRRITGYYKGDEGKPIEEMDIFKGEDIPDWKNFVWKSKHQAVGINLPSAFVSSAENNDDTQNLDSGIHTVIHVLVNAAKIVTQAEPGDIEAIEQNGIIYLYDNTADGANGCSQIIFNEIDKIIEISRDLLSECKCHFKKDDSWDGCQKCTFTTSYCQTKNKNLSKRTAMGFFGLEI